MGFFDGVKCFTGFHDWSLWSYSAADKCDQTRYCKRSGCTKRASQTVHEWPEFSYFSKDSCEQNRCCLRCKSVEKRMASHPWTEWEYVEHGECEQTRKCMRCKAEDEQVEHQWGVWQYEAPNSCVHVRFCRRCSSAREEKPARDAHQWTDFQRMDCTTEQRVCTRCSEKETKNYSKYSSPLHVYGPWRRDYGNRQRRRCQECGDHDYKDT
jgi:hypothetical protein